MFARLALYLKEMFPLPLYLPLSAIAFFGLYFSAQKVVDTGPITIDPRALIGFYTLFGFSLLMRIFDEFKDYEVDKVLFPERALVRGAVSRNDLRCLGWFLVISMTLLNLLMSWVFLVYLFTLIFSVLTFKWFFLKKRISTHLFLAFFTHQPMGVFVNSYAVSVALLSVSPALSLTPWVLHLLIVVFAFFFPVSAWEVSRKVRAPSQETDYITYSSLIGPRWACLLAMLFTVLSCGMFIALFLTLHLPSWSVVLALGILLVFIVVCIRFMLSLRSRDNVIRRAVEICVGITQLLFLVLLVFKFGYVLRGW